jgi:hypothetical protein
METKTTNFPLFLNYEDGKNRGSYDGACKILM